MFRVIKRLRAQRKLRELEAARQVVLEALDGAKRRGDTRSIHSAVQEARRLTTDCVRTEVALLRGRGA